MTARSTRKSKTKKKPKAKATGKAKVKGKDNDVRAVDAYLAALPADDRKALERLRSMIRDAVPDATEVISYGMPTFRHHGGLVAFAAFKDHLSFFVMSRAVMNAHQATLKKYKTSTGTIHFAADNPLPKALVTRLVNARVAENKKLRKR